MKLLPLSPRLSRLAVWSVAALGLLAMTGCAGGDGQDGSDGQDFDAPLSKADPLPGVALEVVRVAGGTGPGGNLQAGDRPAVTFFVRQGPDAPTPGADIPPSEWASSELLFAGPSTNYQLILQWSGLAANSTANADGSWTFTFPDAIPSTVPLQVNQEDTIPYDSGTIAGDALPSGTYTIGMSLRRNVTIAGTTFRDGNSVTKDVLFGSASQLTRPELVTDANCQSCHATLRAHGDFRHGVAVCVLCHTNGAEDLNNPSAVAGETPGLSISFQTMIHKIHSGSHLPSVNGKTVDDNGNPVYGAGTPYVIVRSRGEFDFSEVAFPQWPHLAQGMPRDLGYNALSTQQKAVENAILAGPTNCNACHGDPDGVGPLPAPADGDAIFTNQISTRACIACHDDWDPSKPYTSNGMTMPAGLSDATCTECHGEAPTSPNSAINVRKAHTHPLLDGNSPPLWGSTAGEIGLQFDVRSIGEAQVGNGVLEPGEKVAVEVAITDRDGAAVAAADLRRMEIVISGPVQNPNLLYFASYQPGSSSVPSPTALLGAGPVHTFTLKEKLAWELATPLSATTFQTQRAPHYPTQFGAPGATTVYTVPVGGGGGTQLSRAAPAYQNFLDVADAASLGLAVGNVVVVDEGTADAEYVEVRNVEGNRIWLQAPLDVAGIRLQRSHAPGAEVQKVTPTADGTAVLDDQTGIVTFGAPPVGNVLVTYTTDFVVPAVYRGAINNSPSQDPADPRLDAVIGEWTGFGLVPGTYNIGVYGEVAFDVVVQQGATTQTTTYTEGSSGETVKGFRIGTAGAIEANGRISDAANCYACHRDLQFHGSHRRGYDNCMLCHGNAGAEDWPAFKTTNVAGLQTPGVTIDFREMIHKIHRGHELEAGADYVVAGFNGSAHTYEHVGFPSFLGATANCKSCHGVDNTAWHAPTVRLHPDEPRLAPHLEWRMVCGSCHDGRSAYAHMLANSGGDLESCELCHGAGKDFDVEVVHKHRAR